MELRRLTVETFAAASAWVLMAVFGYTGIAKLGDLPKFSRQLDQYQLLPHWLVRTAAASVAVTEVAIAIGVAVPATRLAAAWLAVAVLATFVAAQCSVVTRKLSIECGCLGGTTELDTVGGASLARAASLVLVALVATQSAIDAALGESVVVAVLLLTAVLLVSETVRLVAMIRDSMKLTDQAPLSVE